MSHNNPEESVAVAVANYNTAESLAHLLFSLYRIEGKKRLARIVVVDNGSTDESVRMLEALADKGLIDVILNSSQHYHGPALNQALDYLSARRRLAATDKDRFKNVWVLDSDTVVLRREIVSRALTVMQKTNAGMLGQFQYDALPEGYAHPSALFLNLDKTFQDQRDRFDDSGAPATELHLALRSTGVPIADFPIFQEGYVLHVGRGTRREVWHRREETNRHFSRGAEEPEQHYHGHPQGVELHRKFLEHFRSEVSEITLKELVAACCRTELTDISLSGCASPS